MENLYTDLKSAVHSAEILHINTSKFSKHKAYEEFYESLRKDIDDLFELYKGLYPFFKVPVDNLIFVNLDSSEIIEKYRSSLREYLESLANTPELQDVINNILNAFNKLAYLLKLD